MTDSRNSIIVGAVFGFWFFSSSVMAGEGAEKGWMVQLGSFREEKNAEQFISRIKKKGYTPFIAKGKDSTWYKIRVGPYPSKLEARFGRPGGLHRCSGLPITDLAESLGK